MLLRVGLPRSFRGRLALSLALVFTALSVAAAHGVPGLEHAGMDHQGVALDDLAVACLGITASAAVAVAALHPPAGVWARPAGDAGPVVGMALTPPVPAARAGPFELEVLRL